MLHEEILFEKIEEHIPDFQTFEGRIISHVHNDYFPLIYQCLYERITPSTTGKFSTEDYKRLLENNFLKLLNDIYRTRLSNDSFQVILGRLDKVKDFNNYELVLEQFVRCNPKRNGNVNALSLGTKVLHIYSPEENPILDSVVRNNLEINDEMDIELCLNFRTAMNNFVNDHKEWFLLDNCNNIKNEFKKYNLKTTFPKMKIIDMALYDNSPPTSF